MGKLTEAKKRKARALFPHIVAGVAIMLDVPVIELEEWLRSVIPLSTDNKNPNEEKLSWPPGTLKAPPKAKSKPVTSQGSSPSVLDEDDGSVPPFPHPKRSVAVKLRNKSTYTKKPKKVTIKDGIVATLERHPKWHAGQIAEHLELTREAVAGCARYNKIKIRPMSKTEIADRVRETSPHRALKGRPIQNPRPSTKKRDIPNLSRPEPKKELSRQPEGTKFYLMNDDKEYLHESCTTITSSKDYAWKGTHDQLLNCRKTFITAENLHEKVVPAL